MNRALREIVQIAEQFYDEWGWVDSLFAEKYGGEYFIRVLEVLEKYNLAKPRSRRGSNVEKRNAS